jgi:hypothetical protein
VIEALATQRAEQHDLRRAGRDRLSDREFEVGLVLRRGELRYRDALAGETLDARIAEGIHVAHDEMRRELPSLECERAAVRGNDVVLRVDDRAVRRQHVAVRDDDGPHRWQNKSGA